MWGFNGETINQTSINKAYNAYKTSTYNKTYYDNKLKEGNGKIGADCSGALFPMSGFDTTAQNYYAKCATKGIIANIDKNKACLVFKGNSTSAINHVGFYCGDGYVIEMKSSKANCVKSALDGGKWKWWGVPNWIDYSASASTSTTSNTTSKYKCIDVSSYQGNIDWQKVHESGISSCILKAIKKNLSADSRFEENYKNAAVANVSVIGFYNYSYATTKEKAITDAKAMLSVLNGRKGTVWLDLEDKTQQGLGSTIVDIINEYGAIIRNAGYVFGVYTGMSFYNSYIKPYKSQINCDNWWIARYYNGYNKMAVSNEPNEQYNPKASTGLTLYGWQYTSSGQVNGISGNVDMNMIYSNATVSNNSAPTTNSATSSETLITMLGRVNTKSSNLNIRSTASSTGSIVGKYAKGDIIQLLAKTANGWYRTGKGYVIDDYIASAIGTVCNCSKLNMRETPEVKTGNVIKILVNGDELTLLKRDNNWYKGKTSDNVVGYVSKKYIEV